MGGGAITMHRLDPNTPTRGFRTLRKTHVSGPAPPRFLQEDVNRAADRVRLHSASQKIHAASRAAS